MAKFCQVDANGLYTAFYDDTIHETIPGDAIAIDDATWQAHIDGSQLSYWNGSAHAALPSQSTVWDEWNGTAWVKNETKQWDSIRAERDQKLKASDYTMATDYYNNVLDAQGRTDWETYRQALRDIPQTYAADPDTVVWPTEPA